MGSFRLVILDYCKNQLDNPCAHKLLSDVVFVKQKNFLRTDPQYVVMDKHDMIGTHYLIYETSQLFTPKLVCAIRTTFSKRAQEHRIETPLMSLLPQLEAPLRTALEQFKARFENLVDCNAWFVDPEYSKKQSGMELSDLAYFLVCMHLMRSGISHFVGCTNEKYKASRWLENVGTMAEGLHFNHPAVSCQHRLILMEKFNLTHFQKIFFAHRELMKDIFEVFPPDLAPSVSLTSFVENLFESFTAVGLTKVSAA